MMQKLQPENFMQFLFITKYDEYLTITCCIYHLTGSLREYSSLAGSNLLIHEIALWGSAHGYKTLYLGGGVGSGADSLFEFKRAFYKGDLNHFYIGKKVFCQEKYDELLSKREPFESGFFPKYRGD